MTSSSSESNFSDHHHQTRVGDRFRHYQIEKRLGSGVFSIVWLASDVEKSRDDPHKLVALKISKSAEDCWETAKDEIKILTQIQDKSPNEFVVKMLDHFVISSSTGRHMVIVFEYLQCSLYRFYRKYYSKGMPLDLLRRIGYQALQGVNVIHSQNIIHTDLKPENFLIRGPNLAIQDYEFIQRCRIPRIYNRKKRELRKLQQYVEKHKLSTNRRKRFKTKIRQLLSFLQNQQHSKEIPTDTLMSSPDTPLKVKLSDLGNGCWTFKHLSERIGTKPYCGPEALILYPYSTPVDVFALGCMLFELATGDMLFDPSKNFLPHVNRDQKQLALMIMLFGPVPQFMRQRGSDTHKFFNRRGQLLHMKEVEPFSVSLEEILIEKGVDPKIVPEFSDLLRHMLHMNVQKRWTVQQVMRHPFFENVNG